MEVGQQTKGKSSVSRWGVVRQATLISRPALGVSSQTSLAYMVVSTQQTPRHLIRKSAGDADFGKALSTTLGKGEEAWEKGARPAVTE